VLRAAADAILKTALHALPDGRRDVKPGLNFIKCLFGGGSTYVAGVIDIEAMRDHRARAQWDNWLKDCAQSFTRYSYEKPIYPKNLYLKREPMKHTEYRQKAIKRQVRLMHDRGIWKKPER
jgi:hypothetical protein